MCVLRQTVIAALRQQQAYPILDRWHNRKFKKGLGKMMP